MSTPDGPVYQVLYTHQKTKKAKTWQDGTLKISGGKGVLFDDKNLRIDTVHLRGKLLSNGEEIESDRFLIQIECQIQQQNNTQQNTISSPPKETHKLVPSLQNNALAERNGSVSSLSVGKTMRTGLKRKKLGFNPPRLVRQCSEGVSTSDQEVKMVPNQTPDQPKFTSPPNDVNLFNIYAKEDNKSSKAEEIPLKPLVKLPTERVLCKDDFNPQSDESKTVVNRILSDINSVDKPSAWSVVGQSESVKTEKMQSKEISKSILSTSKSSTIISNTGTRKRSAAQVLALLHKTGKVQPSETSTNDSNSNSAKVKYERRVNTAGNDDYQCFNKIIQHSKDISDNKDSIIECYEQTKNHCENTSLEQDTKPCFDLQFDELDFDEENDSDATMPSSKVEEKKTFRDLTSQQSLFKTTRIIETAIPNISSTQRLEFKTPHAQSLLNFGTELVWVSKEDVSSNVTPYREVRIPASFNSIQDYKKTLSKALTEYLNVQLFQFAQSYHAGLDKIDISGYSQNTGKGKLNNSNTSSNPPCEHGVPSKLIQVRKEGQNKGRFFYSCNGARGQQCKFFKWADETQKVTQSTGMNQKKVLTLCDPESIMTYFKKQGMQFYCECHYLKKMPEHLDKFKDKPAWVKKKKVPTATLR